MTSWDTVGYAVDGGIVHHRGGIGVGEHGGFAGTGPAPGEGGRALRIAPADGVQAAAVELGDGLGEALRDRAGADEGPVEGAFGHVR